MSNQTEYKLQEFTNEQTLARIWGTMTLLSVAGAGATMYFMKWGNLTPEARTWVAIAWFIGPPAWFFIENSLLLRPDDVELKKERMARFRLSQDTARMCWFGVAAAIIFLARPIT